MATAITILNHELHPLISRAYRHDDYLDAPLDSIFDNLRCVLAEHELKSLQPVLFIEDYNYLFVMSNNLMIVLVVASRHYRHANVMCYFAYLKRFESILKSYFKSSKLDQEMILDNYVLLYQLFDETMDFGFVQISDFNILNEYIRMDVNIADNPDHDDQHLEYMNSSISRMSTTPLSWRPKGIFYKKNEVFLDFVEKVNLLVDTNNQIKKQIVSGEIKIKCFLSGMPTLVLGLNEFLASSQDHHTIDSFKKVKFDNLNFHQCVQLTEFTNDNIISFIPPDGKFTLLNYKVQVDKSPLILLTNIDFKKKIIYRKIKPQITSPVISQDPIVSSTPHSFSTATFPRRSSTLDIDNDDTNSVIGTSSGGVEKTTKLLINVEFRTKFTKRRTATDVSIVIPINFKKYKIDFDYVPRFKTRIGVVILDLEKQCIVWKISSVGGSRTFSMTSELTLLNDTISLKPAVETSELLESSSDEESSDSEAEKTYNYYFKDRSQDKKISDRAKKIKQIYKTIQREQKTIKNASNKVITSQEGPKSPTLLMDGEPIDNINSITDSPGVPELPRDINDTFYINRNMVKVSFKIENLTLSGLKVTYLRIDEPQLKYTSFPWVKYITTNEEEYAFKFDFNRTGPSQTIVKHVKQRKDNSSKFVGGGGGTPKRAWKKI